MKRKFQVVITREGQAYVARCPEVAGTVARGHSKSEVVERMKGIIRKKFSPGPDEGSDGRAAPKPHPVSPSPHGPVAEEAKSHETSQS
jgi:predicted RNase H-like HicB family nuclease